MSECTCGKDARDNGGECETRALETQVGIFFFWNLETVTLSFRRRQVLNVKAAAVLSNVGFARVCVCVCAHQCVSCLGGEQMAARVALHTLSSPSSCPSCLSVQVYCLLAGPAWDADLEVKKKIKKIESSTMLALLWRFKLWYYFFLFYFFLFSTISSLAALKLYMANICVKKIINKILKCWLQIWALPSCKLIKYGDVGLIFA